MEKRKSVYDEDVCKDDIYYDILIEGYLQSNLMKGGDL